MNEEAKTIVIQPYPYPMAEETEYSSVVLYWIVPMAIMALCGVLWFRRQAKAVMRVQSAAEHPQARLEVFRAAEATAVAASQPTSKVIVKSRPRPKV